MGFNAAQITSMRLRKRVMSRDDSSITFSFTPKFIARESARASRNVLQSAETNLVLFPSY